MHVGGMHLQILNQKMIKKICGAILRVFSTHQSKSDSKDWVNSDREEAIIAKSTPRLTRDLYISQPLPIKDELRDLFGEDEALVIFDIGACEGEDSIRYAKMFPRASIFSFEPIPSNLEFAKKQFENYGVENVTIRPIALSDQKGSATFYVSSGAPEHIGNSEDWDFGNKSSSLLPPDEVLVHYPWLKFQQTIEVQTDTIDNFARENSLSRIDLIHMDVQGAELLVLRGAGEILSRTKAIWLEIENVSLYKNQPLAAEMQAFMEQNGFIKMKDTVAEISGDHLYIRP